MVAFTEATATRGLWSHVAIYGDSRSGKTTLALGLLKSFKLIWINLDNGVYLPAAKLSQEFQSRLDLINLPDTNTAPIAYSLTKRLLEGKPVNLCHAHFIADCRYCQQAGSPFTTYEFNKLGYDTIVVVDHMTKASISGLGHICLKAYKEELKKDDLAMYKPKLDDWGSLSYNAGQMMTTVQNAKFNLICLFQSLEQDTEDNKKKLLPNFGSKEFGRNVSNFFDHTVFCEISMNKHVFGSMTGYGMHCATGSRSDIDISKMSPPSLIPFFQPPETPIDRNAVAEIAAPAHDGKFVANAIKSQYADEILAELMKGKGK